MASDVAMGMNPTLSEASGGLGAEAGASQDHLGLHPQGGPLETGYQVSAPARDLAGVVERFWQAAPSDDHGANLYEILPDGNVDLVIGLGESACRLHLYGPATRLAVASTCNRHGYLAVRFLPGQAPRLLDIDPVDLLDARWELDGLGGVAAEELGQRLLAAPDFGSRQAMLEDLLRQAHLAPLAGELCRRAARLALARGGDIRVRDLARELGVGTRRLERSFKSDLGLPPKPFLRLVRLQRAVAGLCLDRQDQAGLAQACGYADQAHMIRDFNALAGRSPLAVADCLRNRMVVSQPPPGAVHHRMD